MKVKIRGLVFAGFAAAVFAQSALAVSADDKTVTSKTYVDSKIEGTSNNATTITSTSSDTNAPSLLNVYKFVENQIVSSGGGIDGDPTKHTQKIAVFDSSYTTPVGTPENPQGEDLNHIIGWKLIVPDSVVAESGSDIGTNIGTTNQSGPASGHGSDLTTAQAVYDFVTGGDDPNSGFHPKLTSTQASVLAGWGNGGQSDEGTAIAVGYRAYDSENPNAVEPSEWKTFGARANGSGTSNDYHLSYLTVQPGSAQERDKYFIDIKAGALAKDVTAISAGGTATGANASLTADKLTTAKAVYDYAVKQNWGAGNAGKKLVINNSGYVDLTDAASGELPPESTMPDVCKTANGNHVCALVAYYDATAQGVVYEWTVMAPTGN